jgi:polygalacturonase
VNKAALLKTGFVAAIAILFIGLISGACNRATAPQYKTVAVKAPFAMDSVRLFVYPERDFNIKEYGAVEGGRVKNTQAIAKAVAACNMAGGGRVIIPNGTWLTGPIHFKSNVNLHLEDKAVILFTDDPNDYLPAVMTSWEGFECYNYSPLLYAFECENIAITGKGSLNPVMDNWRKWFPRPQPHMEALKSLYKMASTGVEVEKRQMAVGQNNLRPHLIQFNRCKTVLLDGFTIQNSPFWTIHMYMCNSGVVRNLNVEAKGHNNDGIDLEMSRNFLVEDCLFNQGDDAVVIKSGSNQDGWRLNTPSENIVIRNCKITAGHLLLGIGSEISGGIRNVYMHDCVAPNTVHRLFFIKTNHRRGAFVENIYMENIKTGGTLRVLEIDTDVLYQWRTLVPTYEERITRINGIHMKNIECKSAHVIYELKGDKKLPVKNVEMKNVHVATVGDTINPVQYVENLITEDITYDRVDATAVSELEKYLNNK